MGVCVQSHFSCVQLCATFWLQPTRLLSPWDSPGRNTRMGCHALLQWIFLNWGSKLAPLNNLSALACGLFTTGATWEAQGGISQSIDRNNTVGSSYILQSYFEHWLSKSWTTVHTGNAELGPVSLWPHLLMNQYIILFMCVFVSKIMLTISKIK